MNDLLRLQPPPTAVFVASDVVAMGAIRAVKRAGLRILHDVVGVGFDDVPLASFYDPPLTTIHLLAHGLGWAAGERLTRLIRGKGLTPTGLLLETELIVRESSAGEPATGPVCLYSVHLVYCPHSGFLSQTWQVFVECSCQVIDRIADPWR